MNRRVRYSKGTGRRVPFDENKVRREGGRFADKPGVDTNAPVKTSGVTRDDVIEGLGENTARLNGRTIGDVLDSSGDEAATLRLLTQRHKAGEIQFRQGARRRQEEEVETGYLGKRYGLEGEDTFSPPRDADGVVDDLAAEAAMDARVARIRPERVVLTAPIRSERGRADADSLRDELMLSYDSDRNRPAWLEGEGRELERRAVEEAVNDYVDKNAKLYTRDYDGDDLMLTLSRPDDSPYWRAREAAEAKFRRDGLTDAQIGDEISGAADARRRAASRDASAALYDASYEKTSRALREAFPNEMRAFEALSPSQGRERFIARSKLLARYKQERGVALDYA